VLKKVLENFWIFIIIINREFLGKLLDFFNGEIKCFAEKNDILPANAVFYTVTHCIFYILPKITPPPPGGIWNIYIPAQQCSLFKA